MKKIIFILLLLFPNLCSADLLAWDASPSTSVAGYKVYYTDQIGIWSETTDQLSIDMAMLNLTPGVEYRMHVTAFNGLGQESIGCAPIDYVAPVVLPNTNPKEEVNQDVPEPANNLQVIQE